MHQIKDYLSHTKEALQNLFTQNARPPHLSSRDRLKKQNVFLSSSNMKMYFELDSHSPSLRHYTEFETNKSAKVPPSQTQTMNLKIPEHLILYGSACQ